MWDYKPLRDEANQWSVFGNNTTGLTPAVNLLKNHMRDYTCRHLLKKLF